MRVLLGAGFSRSTVSAAGSMIKPFRCLSSKNATSRSRNDLKNRDHREFANLLGNSQLMPKFARPRTIWDIQRHGHGWRLHLGGRRAPDGRVVVHRVSRRLRCMDYQLLISRSR